MNFREPYRYIAYIIIFFSILTFYIITNTIKKLTSHEIELSRKIIKNHAVALFDTIVTFRYWSAIHGGVYVKKTPGFEPNPYLKHGTIKTDKGETLILINPAWMTRQIFELFQIRGESTYFYKITSPHPVNPHNAPDEFEKEAFSYFEKNPKEKYYFKYPDKNAEFLHFVGLLRVEKPCLHCHENVKIGDIRGGIRISIPIQTFREKEAFFKKQSGQLITLISFLVLLSGSLAVYLFNALMQKRKEIESANENLENKVVERTREVVALNKNESHLRLVMQTIASINREIINMDSLNNLLQRACDILAEYENFNECWIIEKEKNKYIIKYNSGNGASLYKLIQNKKGIYNLEKFDPVIQAIESGVVQVLNGVCDHYDLKHWVPVFKKSSINSLAVFPVKDSGIKKPHGAIIVFSSKVSTFDQEEHKMMEELVGDLGFAMEAYHRQKDINLLRTERIHNFEETILSFIRLVEERDSYTAGHSVRVANYCRVIGEAMGIDKKDLQVLEKASILHDLGKIATPDSILLRPGKLSPIEYDLVKLHVNSGYGVLSKINLYKDLAEVIKYHHERHDGMGYPNGTKGEDIPLLSRILIVADAFDAMTTDRVYHIRMNKEMALKEIRENSGRQFHPKIAEIGYRALQKVNLSRVVSQFPQTELEKKRFAYFFNDRLTDLYNEDYLFLTIQGNEKIQEYSRICFISLKNFSQYNKRAGWDQGNEVLKKFSSTLQIIFSDSLIFRVQGDDFIIITNKSKKECETQISKIIFIKEYDLFIGLRIDSISKKRPLRLDKKTLNQIFES